MTTPADELRAAAKVLRETAAKAKGERWVGHRWQTMPCYPDECACIVYQGDADKATAYSRETPPLQYVADADSEEHANWIALASPTLADPLADLLENVAEICEVLPNVAARQAEHPEDGTISFALAIARAISPPAATEETR